MTLRILAAIVLLSPCDSEQEYAHQKEAEARAAEKVEQAEAAQRKAAREEEAKREAEEKAAHEAALAELVALPEPLPKSLDKACKAMLAAYDAYMRSVLTGDLKTKWETGGNEMQLKVYGAECQKRSIEVAACQTHALGKMKPEHEKDIGEIFTRCARQFGSG